ncbi:zinc finger MYND domain-containing protein 12 [Platysternon megacephalum]|uniref:Zinc finger MYND domain-containing protein 12 n=1 Tax=Platysternon megacephalum TaxID=55544 RepID=A0A4D9DVS9_9SAUR|nr:zinc finger MYND domain-containing protein 12 [Platysternon megacephalum]
MVRLGAPFGRYWGENNARLYSKNVQGNTRGTKCVRRDQLIPVTPYAFFTMKEYEFQWRAGIYAFRVSVEGSSPLCLSSDLDIPPSICAGIKKPTDRLTSACVCPSKGISPYRFGTAEAPAASMASLSGEGEAVADLKAVANWPLQILIPHIFLPPPNSSADRTGNGRKNHIHNFMF